jgi:hypothetical protein
MLTSAGGILALLQDSPHVRDGTSSNEEIRLKVGIPEQFAASYICRISLKQDGSCRCYSCLILICFYRCN